MNNVDHEAMNTKLRLWSPSTEAMVTQLKKKNQLVPVQLIPKPEILSKKGTS